MNKLQVKKILVIFLAMFSCARAESRDESSCQNSCEVNLRPLSLNVCNHKTYIFDSDGEFLKIVCSVHQGYNYNDAEYFCMKNGMDLLIIENQAEYDEVSKFTLKQWPSTEVWGPGHGVWINGRFFNKKWFAYRNLKKQSIRTAIEIVKDPQQEGNCAVLKRIYTEFELRNCDCTKGYAFYCQYKGN